MATAPRPPIGYSSLAVASTQILLPLTISNKCGQSFRWRAMSVYEELTDGVKGVKVEVGDHAVRIKNEDDGLDTLPVKPPTTRSFCKHIEWSICLADRVVFVRQDEERGYLYHRTMLPNGDPLSSSTPTVQEETAAWLVDYLNLRVPLAELYEEWSEKDKVFARFAKRFTGVRMLRQDPWECLCSFICSSNNNIARIGQMVQNLCTHYSEPLLTYTYPAPPKEVYGGDDGVEMVPTSITYHPFPLPARLAQGDVEEQLRGLSFGYRARYISETARMLVHKVAEGGGDGEALTKYESVQGYLDKLRGMTYAEARSELLQFPGVGPKVADCILLMSMDQPSSIPVDRHVYQFAEKWYRIKTKGGLKGYELIADKFRALWGPYAGWAHSVLFTADLRAFATYKSEKQEDEVKAEGGEPKAEEDERLSSAVKIETVDQAIFHDNGRPARRIPKRQGSTLTDALPAVKRTSR